MTLLNCEDYLTDDIMRECIGSSIAGIEINVLLFNSQDVDREATTFEAASKGTVISALKLKDNKKGYFAQGVKQTSSASFEVVLKDQSEDKYKHGFAFIIPNISTANKMRLDEILKGTGVMALVELKYKGEDRKDAFQLFGWEQGLKVATATYKSNENEGSIMVELSSPDGFEESLPPMTVYETSYDVTATSFTNRFAGAIVP